MSIQSSARKHVVETCVEDPGQSASLSLPTPTELRRSAPLEIATRRAIESHRTAVRGVLGASGETPDPRWLVVIGPCSIHDIEGALEFGRRLAPVAERNSDALLVVMRTYLEKPRSTLGWKGFLNDPHLDGSHRIGEGLAMARRLLMDLGAMGLPCAGEILDPNLAPYLEDLFSWGVVGARTCESQPHRECAAGLPFPVGFKNGTTGDPQGAVDAVGASAAAHERVGFDDHGQLAQMSAPGNDAAHVVLRGGRDGPNHDSTSVHRVVKALADVERAPSRPVVIDCSHGNSGKDHRRQASVARAVLADHSGASTTVAGLMIESHLAPGRQNPTPGTRPSPDRSITDPCMGWDETEALLDELAGGIQEGLAEGQI